MSARGINFLHWWIWHNVSDGADAISARKLSRKLFADAKALGIGSTEMEGSIDEAIRDAIVHHDASMVH
jgi:hypothetical protein